eukprot:4922509-Pleurochrysis_carterae.AAC.4
MTREGKQLALQTHREPTQNLPSLLALLPTLPLLCPPAFTDLIRELCSFLRLPKFHLRFDADATHAWQPRL